MGFKKLFKNVANVATLGTYKRDQKVKGAQRGAENAARAEANMIAEQTRAHLAEVTATAKASQELSNRTLAQSQARRDGSRRARGAGANAFGEYETQSAPLNPRLG